MPDTPSDSPILTGHLDRDAAAKAVGKSARTIKRWEERGLAVIAGPGNMRLYNVETLRSFVLKGGKVDPPSAAKPGRPRKTA